MDISEAIKSAANSCYSVIKSSVITLADYTYVSRLTNIIQKRWSNSPSTMPNDESFKGIPGDSKDRLVCAQEVLLPGKIQKDASWVSAALKKEASSEEYVNFLQEIAKRNEFFEFLVQKAEMKIPDTEEDFAKKRFNKLLQGLREEINTYSGYEEKLQEIYENKFDLPTWKNLGDWVAAHHLISFVQNVEDLRETAPLGSSTSQVEEAQRIREWMENNKDCLEVTQISIHVGSGYPAIPPELAHFSHLQKLEIAGDLHVLPSFIGNLPNLTTLKVSGKNLTSLPESIGQLSKLETLKVEGSLESLPESMGQLAQLKSLDLHKNQLQSLPASFDHLSNLERVDLRDNLFPSPPDSLERLPQLRFINLSSNGIESPSATLGKLERNEMGGQLYYILPAPNKLS